MVLKNMAMQVAMELVTMMVTHRTIRTSESLALGLNTVL